MLYCSILSVRLNDMTPLRSLLVAVSTTAVLVLKVDNTRPLVKRSHLAFTRCVARAYHTSIGRVLGGFLPFFLVRSHRRTIVV